MIDEITTTIADVLGGAPWRGRVGITVNSATRAAVRTWLSRMGWKTEQYLNLSTDVLEGLYTSSTFYEDNAPETASRNDATAATFAHAEYSPRNAALLEYLRQRAGNAQAQDEAQAQGEPKTPPVKINPPPAGQSTPADDDAKAKALKALLDILSSSGKAPLDEARVIELIREHSAAPVVHRVEIVKAGEVAQVKGTTHPKMPVLAKVLASRMTNGFTPNVWIYGPTASGKTHAVEQIAEAMGAKFYMHGAMSMAHELMGYRDAGGNYLPTCMREGFEHGGVVMCDEIDSWDSQVTLALNSALANGYASFPDGMVKRHPDCIFVGAANTTGSGATADFVGRNRLDAAFLSRFPVKIEWPRDPAIELAIAANDAWVNRVVAARARAEAAGIKHPIDPRHSQAGAALIRAGMTPDEAAELTYLAGLTDAQIRTVEGR
jgi:cobaltochelatase CobS